MMQYTNPLYSDIVRRMAAEAKEKAPELSGDLLARAMDLVLREAIIPPRPTAWFYTVQDGEAIYPIHLESTAKLGPCACESAEHPCVHRLAVRLYINCQAELRRMISESLHDADAMQGPLDTDPEAGPPTPLPEMRAVALLDVTIDGAVVRLTLRDMDDRRLMARIQQWYEYFPRTAPAPTPAHAEPEAALPAEVLPQEEERDTHGAALRADWCTVHQATMHQNKRGWAHKVAEGIWCPGHWCSEHNSRYWENQGRSGPFWSHKLESGGFCSEKKRQTAGDVS